MSASTVWKYTLTLTGGEAQTFAMPGGAVILTVQTQGEHICLWARVRPDHPYLSHRRFVVVGTGHPLKLGVPLTYIGTVQQPPFVWHVFELQES